MGTIDAPTGDLATALEHASSFLQSAPELAERQALEILAAAPSDPRAVLILGSARRRMGELVAAREVLASLAQAQPRSAQTHCELGLTLGALGEDAAAIAALRAAVALKRELPEAWRALGDLSTVVGDSDGAERAYGELIRASVKDPVLMQAADALCGGRLAETEHLLRGHLAAHPTDVAAMRMLAETGTRLGRYGDVEEILSRCLELAPGFSAARYNLAIVLYRQQRAVEAIPHLERLLSEAPQDPGYRNLMAACLGLVGEYERSITIYRQVLAEHPAQPKIWLSFGHALKTAGATGEAIGAYNKAIAMAPSLGEAYWSLANLKTVPFSQGEIGAMQVELQGDLSAEDRLHLHYALGKALEDAGDWAASFEHYAAGARLRRAEVSYDAEETTAQMERSRSLLTEAFFAGRTGGGSDDPAPIFIVGLPRSGSTLIEQILASHSAVEGTMELPDMVQIAREMGRPGRKAKRPSYPGALLTLGEDQRAVLGARYIERTRIHRKLGRPYFVDKMPNNFHHTGLIRLILPKAKIIDARRQPMAACFSAFKQHFARGQNFSYDLTELGRYYRDYVELMAHFDAVLPGSVHRVIHEDLVDDIEGEVRRLLDFCGLAFEPACLRFWETDRAVRTASSEQVRRPIFRAGLDQWRHYEPWLEPLEGALGPALRGWRSK